MPVDVGWFIYSCNVVILDGQNKKIEKRCFCRIGPMGYRMCSWFLNTSIIGEHLDPYSMCMDENQHSNSSQ